MFCDKCGAPSVYHSTLIVNGVSQKTSLCRECALKEGVFSNQKTSLFDEMFSTFSDMLGYEQLENVVCPVCKTSLKEFKSVGKLGCPNCYDMFKEEISNIIKRIAPFETHKQETLKVKDVKPQKPSKEEQIRLLREEMKQAVSEERYEDAAKIKKQITKLENANE
jgi:protein arginine kinase activator